MITNSPITDNNNLILKFPLLEKLFTLLNDRLVQLSMAILFFSSSPCARSSGCWILWWPNASNLDPVCASSYFGLILPTGHRKPNPWGAENHEEWMEMEVSSLYVVRSRLLNAILVASVYCKPGVHMGTNWYGTFLVSDLGTRKYQCFARVHA